MDIKISPSMLASDFANLESELKKCETGGAILTKPLIKSRQAAAKLRLQLSQTPILKLFTHILINFQWCLL